MIGEEQSKRLKWEIVGDKVKIRKRSNNKLICEDTVWNMVDYAFRHTDYGC